MIEKTISSKLLLKGKFLDFIEDTIEIENHDGKHYTRQYVVHPGGVCVVPILDDKRIVLVKQFRKPLEKTILEIPAGKIDSHEPDTLDTAQRELREETGYTAENWKYLGEIYPCPGYSTEILHIYVATGLTAGKQDLDEGEVVETEILSLPEITEKINSGEIKDSKTISAVFMALEYLA